MKTGFLKQLNLLFLLGALCVFQQSCDSNSSKKEIYIKKDQTPLEVLDQLAIDVSPTISRPFSFTNKQSAHFYGMTHTNHFDDWFAGLNIAQKRIFKDYQLYHLGQPLDRTQARVLVNPGFVQRFYSEGEERLYLFDEQELVYIEWNQDSPGISLSEELCKLFEVGDDYVLYKPKELPSKVLVVAPVNPVLINHQNGIVTTEGAAKGFFIFVSERSKAVEDLKSIRANYKDQLNKRMKRMADLVNHKASFHSVHEKIDQSIAWAHLTLDQLVMNQAGQVGIYAGLPWFNEFWGRDTFISMPGACLVSGDFASAKQILLDFAEHFEEDPKSEYYGRVPNRIKPDEVIYNTADATPRFVIQALEYVKYSGDTAFVSTVFPIVKESIVAAIKHRTDKEGFLIHHDADTWMDAKLNGEIPYSPRGNRANDIQSLWYQQLKAGVQFATFMGLTETAKEWNNRAKDLHDAFVKHYLLTTQPFIADHLNADGSRDRQLRPNALFAFELLPNEDLRMQLVEFMWSKLVYPWGTASLSQQDSQFHALHVVDSLYPKDEAYHNGTVWPWLNGKAMELMLKQFQTSHAFDLWDNMSTMVLERGVVGGLSENLDAHARNGNTVPNLSGAFLQAWSNAEFLRVWYQGFMGIVPDALTRTIKLAPLVPENMHRFMMSSKVWNGHLDFKYSKGEEERFDYKFIGLTSKVLFSLPGFHDVELFVREGDELKIAYMDNKLSVQHYNRQGESIGMFEVEMDMLLMDVLDKKNDYFNGLEFCHPNTLVKNEEGVD